MYCAVFLNVVAKNDATEFVPFAGTPQLTAAGKYHINRTKKILLVGEHIEIRSNFSSTINHVYVVHTQENALYSHLTWPLASHLQAAFPSTHLLQFAITYFSSFLPVVDRWSDRFFEIADGFLASGRVLHQLLDGQVVNELVRYFVGISRLPFLSLCVPGCCSFQDNLVKTCA